MDRSSKHSADSISDRSSKDSAELTATTAQQQPHSVDESKSSTNKNTKTEVSKVSRQSSQRRVSSQQTANVGIAESTSKNGKGRVKEEPEISTMENVSSLNNLIRAAAAETLNSKPTSAGSQKLGGKGYQGNPALQSNCITAAHSFQQPTPNFLFGQPQFTTASAQPQFFIAGPSPTHAGGMPYQQILIPINQPAQIQQNLSGNQMPAQQYITIPVSLGMGSAQPIQILANQPIIAAANLTGLQPFAMIPNQMNTNESSMSTQSSKQLTSASSSLVPPMFLSAQNPAILSNPQLQPSTHQHQQPDVTTTMSADFNSQIAKFLPSIQSLVNTSISSQHCSATNSTGEITSANENCSPGANETLVSSTEPGSVIDGINLDEIKDFAKQFKSRRLSMGLTQTQVGQALSVAEGPAYSQSAICRFEKLDITPKSAQKIKPVLEKWLLEAEARYHSGGNSMNGADTSERSKKRKRRTSFTPQAVETLTEYFLKNTHPSGTEMTSMANNLGYDREVVRVWFCNKRQALKNSAKRLKPDTSSTTDIQPLPAQ